MLRLIGINASQLAVAGGGFESIASVTAAGGESILTLTSIPSDYQHLQIRGWVARNTASDVPVQLRLNEDLVTLCSRHSIYGDGSSVSVLGDANYAEYIDNIGRTTGTTTGGTFITDIHDYANTSKYTTVRSIGGYDANGSGRIYLTSGLYLSTDAIDAVSVRIGGASFQAGSTFALYGIKAA